MEVFSTRYFWCGILELRTRCPVGRKEKLLPLPYPLGYFFSMLFALADDAGKDLPRDARLAPGKGRYHTQGLGKGPLVARQVPYHC
jgi:hypothetical protein